MKAVENDKTPRITLDRTDAINLLRQTHATCLFGLHLEEGTVHFQFIDRSFIDYLLKFLNGNKDSASVNYKAMSSDSDSFRRQLKKYSQPFEQNRLRIYLIQQRVRSGIPGAELSIKSDDEETASQIQVPWIGEAFRFDSENEQHRLKYLREGIVDESVELHPSIMEAIRETNSTRAVVAGGHTALTKVRVKRHDKSIVEPFEYRELGTERNYVHRSGLRITMDRATIQHPDGSHHHPVQSEIFLSAKPKPLVGSTLNFFRLFFAGATIELILGFEMPLEAFGEVITSIGEAVDDLSKLCSALKLPAKNIALGDLSDEEFSRTAQFLTQILLYETPIGIMANGFVIGPAADVPVEQLESTQISIRVPIAMNWKQTGILVWADCDGEAFLWDGLLCGLRLKTHSVWQIRKTKRFKKSIYPEMWFAKDWPAVPIREQNVGTFEFRYEGQDRPLEAIILRRGQSEPRQSVD